MNVDGSSMVPLPSLPSRQQPGSASAQGQTSSTGGGSAQVVAASASQEESGARFGLPYPPPPGWLEAQAALHERLWQEKGIDVTDQFHWRPPTEEERLEDARQKQAAFAREASFRYSANAAPSVAENHDTMVPNIAGLSLKWATVVRDVVQDLVKHPGPGTLYGGYGDKTTHSATELLGWIDDYIAKLSAAPDSDQSHA